MSQTDKPIAIFVDTNYLLFMPKEEEADWNRLLHLSRNNELKIFLSEIVLEEWKGRNIDEIWEKIVNIQSCADDLQRTWNRNEITKNNHAGQAPKLILPNEEHFRTSADDAFSEFLEKNKIELIRFSPEHGIKVWRKYFSWTDMFYLHPKERTGKRRMERRKNIPDAWIMEATLDIASAYQVICLGGDGELCKNLESAGLDIARKAKEIMDRFYASDAVGEEVTNNDLEDERRSIKDALQSLAEKEEKILTEIMGLIAGLAPLPKEHLIYIMTDRGYDEEIIISSAMRLNRENIIRDTGSHYLPRNIKLCDFAAEQIMPLLTELVNGQRS